MAVVSVWGVAGGVSSLECVSRVELLTEVSEESLPTEGIRDVLGCAFLRGGQGNRGVQRGDCWVMSSTK